VSATGTGHSVLVIVRTVEHGQALALRIPGSEVVFAKLPTRRRRELIAAFRDGSLKCLISTSLADEGLDVPRASVLILACGGRSSAKTEQRTGRVLRAFSGKSEGRIVDFHDQGHGMLISQSRARSRLYQSLGYREVWIPQGESLRTESGVVA
jgi:superfamily II DNA or RNA helicase